MQVLRTLSVPLDRVDVSEHTQIEDVIGVVGGFLTPGAGKGSDPRRVAVQFTRANRQLVSESYVVQTAAPAHPEQKPALVRPTAVNKSPAGYHVQLQQSYQGIPVYGGRAVVHMTKDRGVYFYTSDLHPARPEAELGKGRDLNADEALESLSSALPWRDRTRAQPRCSMVYFPGDGSELQPAWCIDLSLDEHRPIADQTDRSGDWRAVVDVQSGEVLQLLDVSLYDWSWGRVFYPNPVVALENEELSWDAQLPDSAYRKIRLAGLDGSGFLRGRYANTAKTPNRVREPSGQFLYRRGEHGFVEVMAYGFVSRMMSWLARRGWASLFPSPIGINANAAIGDNSKFLPNNWELRFGAGKVMDAEDASIIIHELGHAIQEAQVSGWGTCQRHAPVRAMGEGFADWLATLYFAQERRRYHDTHVGDWDARGYVPPHTHLRRVDASKTMNDWAGDEHADGEIWSAALWDLYLKLGGDSADRKIRSEARDTAIRLLLTSHLYLSDGRRETLEYAHGVSALLDADRFTSADVTQPGPHEQMIREVFAARGITA
jgi:hypothetical protein